MIALFMPKTHIVSLQFMSDTSKRAPGSDVVHGGFDTTLWTVVLNAGQENSPQSQAALEKLCHTYWYPLYAYVRRQGHSAEEAEDLIQEFFHRVIAKNYLQSADRTRGRFRTFLLTLLKHFLAKEWHRSQAQKRGGGATTFSLDAEEGEERYRLEPASNETPETIFQQRWVQALLEQVMTRLKAEFSETGKAERFEVLSGLLLDPEGASQAEAAERLGMSESAVKSAMHRMRQRYAELVREEISNTVAHPTDVDQEIRELFSALER
jgi:RNA polymerase sigma factor (sigma-70 family)